MPRPAGCVSDLELKAYRQMARLHNMGPSLVLVWLGAWAGSGHSLLAVPTVPVFVVSLVSVGVAMASCVINDYFDWASGVDDKASSPDKPLPAGILRPELAVLFAGALYAGVLIAGLFIEPPGVRAIIALSAGATLLYTPVFKRMTLVKNITVAAVVAMSLMAGALAANTGGAGMMRVMPAAAFTFGGVMHREIMMDITDAPGDGAAGVRSLAVMFGPHRALQVATVAAGTSAAVGACWLAASAVVSAGSVSLAVTTLRAGAALAVSAIGAGLVAQAVSVRRASFHHEALAAAVEDCKALIGLGIVILAAMAC